MLTMRMILFTFSSFAAFIALIIVAMVTNSCFRNKRALKEKALFLLTIVYVFGLYFFMIGIEREIWSLNGDLPENEQHLASESNFVQLIYYVMVFLITLAFFFVNLVFCGMICIGCALFKGLTSSRRLQV